MNVTFYELQDRPFEKVIAGLCAKIYEQNQRVVIVLDTLERLRLVDQTLWTFSKRAFLPHGHAQLPQTQWSRQPIWLSLEIESPNQAPILILTDGRILPTPTSFTRVLDVFQGTQEACAAAQKRREHYRSCAFTVTTWQEETSGTWKKMPE